MDKQQKSVFSQGGLFTHTYYGLLGLHPSASGVDIRRAYRELSKLYHPDTTALPLEEAKTKFQCLNEAYGVLANPERRSLYDLQIGYSRWNVIQSPLNFYQDEEEEEYKSSAYLDPTDRPLSSGELFALLLMGVTLFACVILALFLAWLRG
ncbi:MAG: J domain-containing protein [Cyanobacterium sp.]